MSHRRVCRLLIRVDEQDALYRPYGELTSGVAEAIERICLAKLGENRGLAIIDLRRTRYFGADALRCFLRLHLIAKSIQKKVIFMTTPFQDRLLKITALDRILDTGASLEHEDLWSNRKGRATDRTLIQTKAFSFYAAS